MVFINHIVDPLDRWDIENSAEWLERELSRDQDLQTHASCASNEAQMPG